MQRGRLAELHLHLYGTIRAADFLDYLLERGDIDWGWYEHEMRKAYGDVPPLRDVLAQHRSGDPAAAAAFNELFVFGDADAGNFDRFQAKFNLLTQGSEIFGLARGDESAFERLRVEIARFLAAIRVDQLAQGIGYAEQRLLIGGILTGDLARAALDDVLAYYAATSDDALTQRLAVGLPRADPWPLWEHAQELALGPTGDHLTGVDFCFVEEGHPPKDKADFFDAVHEFNATNPARALAILYHVGESFRDKSLESAVRWVQQAAELGAHRLGHAIALGVDPACYGDHERTESIDERLDQITYDLAHAEALARHGVHVDRDALRAEQSRLAGEARDVLVRHTYDAARLDEVRRRQDFAMDRVTAAGAVVEVCPTSNRRIGAIADAAHHPVHRFLERGVPVVVGSDDPGIFGITLEQELDWVVATAGLTDDERRALVDASWRYRSEVMVGRVPPD
jgi:adenosine deaminase